MRDPTRELQAKSRLAEQIQKVYEISYEGAYRKTKAKDREAALRKICVLAQEMMQDMKTIHPAYYT